MSHLDSAEKLKEGTRLPGGFVIRKPLGKGGTSSIFEAWQEHLKRFVAIKFPLDDSAAGALLEEADRLGAFSHGGLPTVHMIGEYEGRPFLVLERLDGSTLEEILARHRDLGGLPWREALHYVRRVAKVLEVLHQANVVHRDVKPDNIMVCRDGRIVLLDLGISKYEADFGKEAARSGTPMYLAPEVISVTPVASGQGHFLDIYALGVLAFELLTGLVPYEAATLPELLDKTLQAPVPSVVEFREGIPAAFNALVLSMMQKHPTDRPPSIQAIRYQLRAIAENRKLDDRESRKLSVLLVDDDSDYHELMRTSVELFDMPVDLRLASDGVAALELLREQPCDLSISDLEMPRMNGMELCMYVHGMPSASNTLIVVMSGRAATGDRALLNSLGVIDFIDKSTLDLEGFVRRMNACLARTSAVIEA